MGGFVITTGRRRFYCLKFNIWVCALYSGQTRRTLFDVLKDENNFSEIYEKRRNRLSSGEVSPTSKTSRTRSTSQELEQENQAENEFK